MTDVAIRCEGLAKQYRIGERESYKALRDVITDAFASPFRRLRSALRHSSNGCAGSEKPNVWALKDVSFEIKRGEVVGIMGRNGAGKSTLLKILARITEPTHGHADIWGRVGSLLEVGTGFHPELTGRENIFLNGAVLGMKRTEIARKFDEIVTFAGIEKFIDTPVKRYSSGMYVRLAFAVAAHMETEILLVDEVLAVGDTEFQNKCRGKMSDVAKHGRTVLLVSHSMAAIQSLCARSMLLEQGRKIRDGDAGAVARYYTSNVGADSDGASIDLRSRTTRRTGRLPILSAAVLMNAAGNATKRFAAGDDLILEIEIHAPVSISQPVVSVAFDSALGQRVFTVSTLYSPLEWNVAEAPTRIRCVVPDLRLVPGTYFVGICVGTVYEPLMDAIPNAASFSVESADYFGTGRMPGEDLGLVLAPSQWEISQITN
jgi:lipopolysaccharide transport system ATP-binding protein